MSEHSCRLIVIDGLDGSGKATQSRLLCERLSAMGYRVKQLTFPDYDSDSSAPVRMYLSGELGDSADDVNAYAASSFFAVDRIASYIRRWRSDYESCDFLIADRYTTSNIIHQMSKLDDSERRSFCDWLFDYEYHRLGIPAPDIVLFLDVDPAVSQRLIAGRYDGDESKKDIHEKDVSYLLRCRESALWAIAHLSWTVIDCSADGALKSVDAISDLVFDALVRAFDV